MREFDMTHHALARAVDMALDIALIRELALNPEVRYWDATAGHAPGWVHRTGQGSECVAAIVDESGDGMRIIRTFLPGNRAAWEKDSQFIEADGRDSSRYLKT